MNSEIATLFITPPFVIPKESQIIEGFTEHLWCSSVRSKTQSFHPISVNFVIENRNTIHTPVFVIPKESQIIEGFPEYLRCSLEPSKTQSFHPISVNFVIENRNTIHATIVCHSVGISTNVESTTFYYKVGRKSG